VLNKVLALLQKWGIQFKKDHDILPLFSDVYDALKAKGFQFPDYVPDAQPTANGSQQR
jgi:hypothetical protein